MKDQLQKAVQHGQEEKDAAHESQNLSPQELATIILQENSAGAFRTLNLHKHNCWLTLECIEGRGTQSAVHRYGANPVKSVFVVKAYAVKRRKST